MNGNVFRHCSSFISSENIQAYVGSENKNQIIQDVVSEWNAKICLSDLSKKWNKRNSVNTDTNLLVLIYNVNSLNGHIADVDVILNNHTPRICIVSEIGKAAIKTVPNFPNSKLIVQEGTNSLDSVAILIHQSIHFKVVQ